MVFINHPLTRKRIKYHSGWQIQPIIEGVIMAKKSKNKYKHLIKTHEKKSTKPTEFDPDYSDVIKDLKRIGILAATFVTLLVVISFIIK